MRYAPADQIAFPSAVRLAAALLAACLMGAQMAAAALGCSADAQQPPLQLTKELALLAGDVISFRANFGAVSGFLAPVNTSTVPGDCATVPLTVAKTQSAATQFIVVPVAVLDEATIDAAPGAGQPTPVQPTATSTAPRLVSTIQLIHVTDGRLLGTRACTTATSACNTAPILLPKSYTYPCNHTMRMFNSIWDLEAHNITAQAYSALLRDRSGQPDVSGPPGVFPGAPGIVFPSLPNLAPSLGPGFNLFSADANSADATGTADERNASHEGPKSRRQRQHQRVASTLQAPVVTGDSCPSWRAAGSNGGVSVLTAHPDSAAGARARRGRFSGSAAVAAAATVLGPRWRADGGTMMFDGHTRLATPLQAHGPDISADSGNDSKSGSIISDDDSDENDDETDLLVRAPNPPQTRPSAMLRAYTARMSSAATAAATTAAKEAAVTARAAAASAPAATPQRSSAGRGVRIMQTADSIAMSAGGFDAEDTSAAPHSRAHDGSRSGSVRLAPDQQQKRNAETASAAADVSYGDGSLDDDEAQQRERARAQAQRYLDILSKYGRDPVELQRQLQWRPMGADATPDAGVTPSVGLGAAPEGVQNDTPSTGALSGAAAAAVAEGAAPPTSVQEAAAAAAAAAAAGLDTTGVDAGATASASTEPTAGAADMGNLPTAPGAGTGTGTDTGSGTGSGTNNTGSIPGMDKADALLGMLNVGGVSNFFGGGISVPGTGSGAGGTGVGSVPSVETAAAAAASKASSSIIGLDPSAIFTAGDELNMQSHQQDFLKEHLSVLQQQRLTNQTELLSAAEPLAFANNTAFISLKIRPLGAGPVELVTPCASYLKQDTLAPPVYDPSPVSISPFGVRTGAGIGSGGGGGGRQKKGRRTKRRPRGRRAATMSAERGAPARYRTYSNNDDDDDDGDDADDHETGFYPQQRQRRRQQRGAWPDAAFERTFSPFSFAGDGASTNGGAGTVAGGGSNAGVAGGATAAAAAGLIRVKDAASGETVSLPRQSVHLPRPRITGAVNPKNVRRLGDEGAEPPARQRPEAQARPHAGGGIGSDDYEDESDDESSQSDGASDGGGDRANSPEPTPLHSVTAGSHADWRRKMAAMGSERYAAHTRRTLSAANDWHRVVVLPSSSDSSSSSTDSSKSVGDNGSASDEQAGVPDLRSSMAVNMTSDATGAEHLQQRQRRMRTQQNTGGGTGAALMSDCVVRAVLNSDGTTSGVECMPTFSACPTATALDSSTLWSVTRVPFSDVPASSLFIAETMTNINYDMDYATINTYPFVVGQMALRNFSPFEQFLTARARKSIVQSVSFRWSVGITPAVNVAFADLPSVIIQPIQNLLNALLGPVITFLETILPGLSAIIGDITLPTASLSFIELAVPISFSGTAVHTEGTDISIAYSITAPPQSHVIGRGIAHIGRSSVPFSMDLARRVHVPAGVFGQLTGQVINYEYRIPGVYDGANLINTEFIVDTL